MRAFKNKWFNRWARSEDISDSVLFEAAIEIVEGKVEADLLADTCLKNDWHVPVEESGADTAQ